MNNFLDGTVNINSGGNMYTTSPGSVVNISYAWNYSDARYAVATGTMCDTCGVGNCCNQVLSIGATRVGNNCSASFVTTCGFCDGASLYATLAFQFTPIETGCYLIFRYSDSTGFCSLVEDKAVGDTYVGAVWVQGVTSTLLPQFACTQQDATCAALGDLYASTNGVGWFNAHGWVQAAAGVPTDYCRFDGVGSSFTAPATPCAFLNLPGNNLNGTLPESLGNTSFQALDFSYNPFLRGQLPDSLAMMNLRWLSAPGCGFDGTLPAALPTSMYALIVYENRMHGTIPSSYCSLSSLVGFLLSDNELSGTIPECIGDRYYGACHGEVGCMIGINGNDLEGTIPDRLTSAVGYGVTDLELAGNHLCGTVPAGLRKLASWNWVLLETSGNPADQGSVCFVCGPLNDPDICYHLGVLYEQRPPRNPLVRVASPAARTPSPQRLECG